MPFHKLSIVLIIFIINSCATGPKRLELSKGQKLCISNLSQLGEKVKVVYQKKKIVKCEFLKKLRVQYCETSPELIVDYHTNLLRNETGNLKGDTIYTRRAIRPSKRGYIMGRAYRCKPIPAPKGIEP
jgi:hypothetical protein